MRTAAALLCALALWPLAGAAQTPRLYLGFDKNEYPGDQTLAELRRSFRFTGYWLNNPPGADHNSWMGKRARLQRRGFGFLLLFNGRLHRELAAQDAAALGAADGETAVAAARREGFARTVRIYLDVEEGGRLLPDQTQYLFAWAQAVRRHGARPGVYCSAIEVPVGQERISTAAQIEALEEQRLAAAPREDASLHLKLWAANDQCPPAPGCALNARPPALAAPSLNPSSIGVWQFAQSPRRAAFSSGCPANAAPDGGCYAPLPDSFHPVAVDLNVSASPSPSEER